MMIAKVFSFLVILVVNFKVYQCKRYDNYTLYTAIPDELNHLKFLQNLEKQQKYTDVVFWKRPSKLHHDVQFIVNPTDRDLFLERVNNFKMKIFATVPDIQQEFDIQNKSHRRYHLKSNKFTWDNYHSLEDIYQWLSDIAIQFSKVVKVISIGKSVEGRDIFALEIKRGRGKHRVLIEGGIHGNEWISTEYALYMAHQVLFSACCNDRIYFLAMRYHWLIIPVLNPDGFVYSQTEDRLWKKNRRSDGGGINLNRNFPYSFGKYGTSSNPKSDYYPGGTAFSEPETKVFARYVRQYQDHMRFYFAFHGYGQKIIIPYSDRMSHVDDYSEMENFGKQAILQMYKLHKMKYAVGTFYDTMGLRISGDSASWAKKTFKIKYVFTFLLRDNGTYGHALPTNQILPACEEMMAGMIKIMVAKPKRVRLVFSSASIRRTDWLLCLCWLLFML